MRVMKYIALDFETGNASRLSACSLGASVFYGNRLQRQVTSLIRPPDEVGKFHWGNIRIHHITNEMVEDAPTFDIVWRQLADEAEDSVFICHNAQFDISVLCACLEYYHLPIPNCRYLCTVKMSQRVWVMLDNHKLDTVAHALNIPLNHHEAGSDAYAAGLILQAALRSTNSANADILAEKIGMQLGSLSPKGSTPCCIAKKAPPRTSA